MARIKRMLSLILCFALVAGYIPAPVSAEEVSQQVQEEAAEPVTEAAEESVTEETEAPTTEATEPETEATEEPVTEETTEPATEATESAVEEEPQLEYAAQEPQNAAATNEGTCGDSLTWVFDETTGTLTISGTGEMYSYEDDDAPWDDYKSQITSILLPEGLTQVGYSAFDRTAITSITIPDSVTRINDYAFSSCSSLTDVDLGDGCSIYECAFYACPVKNLNLGHSGYFGFQAFTSSYITSITIAASRAQFDDGAFWNAGVKEVHFTGAAPGSVTDKDIMTGSTVSSFRDVTWYYDCSQSGWTTSSRYDAANKTWAGYTLVSENHVPVTDEAVAATCTTDGLTEGSHCSVCGEVIVAQEVIPAGHTVVDGICTGCQNYGECGNGIYWKRDENYTMTFYGTGAIESGNSSGNPPFDLLVHNIIISEGITDIGTGLFGYLGRAYLGDGLQSVNIASTVTAIGANAFANCGNVSSINFNGDAPAIDANAFAGLTAIASYPDGNDTWTDVIKETYGGNITWVAVGSDSSEPSEPVPTTPPETEPEEVYALIFKYLDSDGNWISCVVDVKPGENFPIPATPVVSGKKFTGWVSNDGNKTELSFPWYVGMPTDYIATYVDATDDDLLVDLTVYAYYYVGGEYHHKTKLLTQQFVNDSLSNSMVTWLYKDGISAVKSALATLEGADGYLWDPIVFYNCIGDSEISEGDVMVADGNKAVYVKVTDKEAVNASVMLHVHTAQEATVAQTIKMSGYTVGDFVSVDDVLAMVGNHYTGDNMTMSNLYDAVSWEDLMNGQGSAGAATIKVAGDTVEIHVILTDAAPVSPVIGTVKQNLNVRSAPSTTASIVKQLEAGTQVEILKTQTVMDVEWGLTADGWILMAYVDLDGASGDADNTCGDNLTWSFDKNTGTLTISGTGNMADYPNAAPWAVYGKEIVNLVIENGVTGIGDYAFRDCAALYHATFPASLARIGEAAFPKFERELPDGSTVVYGQPFWSEIDQTVRQWYTVQMEADNEGFPYWDTTTFRNDAPIVASGVFGQTMYWELDDAGIATIFGTGNSYEFWATGSQLGNYPVKSIVMEEGVSGINLNAFEGLMVENVTIASTVKTIETMSFADCQSLNTITFLGDAPTFGADCFRNVTATAIYPADNATWTAAVMQDYEGDILWIPSGAVENRVSVSLAELNGQTSVWIDGREYAVQTDGDMAYVDLPDSRAKTMMVYSYHVGDAADVHTQYPIGMKVWLLTNTDGYYIAARTEAFDDILQYAGMSIRVFGQKGIRMITSIEQATKTALTSGGLEGYTLKEYGTVIAWDSYLTATKPLVLDASYAKHNYAYKQGIADPVFQYVGDRMQYTNVLVDFTNDQCKNDLAMRPYMILEHENGEGITLYGGIVRRSIGYIAYQNRNVFEPGSDPYEYVWEIIRYVYGIKYDKEYIISWSPPAM